MGLMDFLDKMLFNSADDEVKDKIERINAGSLEHIFDKANDMGLDLFNSTENNGYVKNNNQIIEKRLSLTNPNFHARDFIGWTKTIFNEVVGTEAWDLLLPDIKDFVDKDFKFGSIEIEKPFNFSTSYLHLYERIGDEEYLQVCISVMTNGSDRDARRFFVRFKRLSQFKIIDMRRVKTTACPNCGGPVFFKRGNVSQCEYCNQYITFEEYGWLLSEIEEIDAQTQINNIGVI